jgi:hypothetical protein
VAYDQIWPEQSHYDYCNVASPLPLMREVVTAGMTPDGEIADRIGQSNRASDPVMSHVE